MTTQTGKSKADRIGRPSPLACTACRSKHLKCDALVPICSRCIEGGLHCNYTPSRRGIGGRVSRKSQNARNASGPSPAVSSLPTDQSTARNIDRHHHRPPSISVLSNLVDPPQIPSPAQTWVNAADDSAQYGTASNKSPTTSTSASTSTSPQSSLRSEDEHLINLFYSHFHDSHPILVPRHRFTLQDYPEHLKSAVKFIGSHYAANIPSHKYQSQILSAMDVGSEKSPEIVQTLLLYCIGLHARYEPLEAMSAIAKAIEMALEIGMNTADFAVIHGNNDPTYEESLRRTWWELYISDGYLAALHRHTSFRCNAVSMSTLLPRDDLDYNAAAPSQSPKSLAQFDARLFSDGEEPHFSSFCYRIDAIRILSRVIAVSSTNDASADSIQAIDNAIAGWKFHLPDHKAGFIDKDGNFDHQMVQASMFIHAASIFLHFPRSELPITMPPAAEIACAQRHMEQVSPTSTQHAVKALSASKDLINLASLPVERHSPYFICGLVFACIVQLSACTAYPKDVTQENRDRIALIIGVLKSQSRHWAIARYVSQQLKRAANEIFNPSERAAPALSSSSHDSGIDLASFPADMSWLDLFYSEGLQSAIPGSEPAGL